MRVVLGNRDAVEGVVITDEDGSERVEVRKLKKDKRATVIDIDDETPLSTAFVAITSPQGVWANHAADGTVPAWVASDSEAMGTLLAAAFGGIEIRDLEDVR